MSTIRNVFVTASAAAIAGLMPASALAQRGQTAELTGTVIDASRGAIAGAKVEVASPQLIGGSQQVVTDSRGQYRFSVLLPGACEGGS